MKPVYYLGPQGSFTHQAAAAVAAMLSDGRHGVGKSDSDTTNPIVNANVADVKNITNKTLSKPSNEARTSGTADVTKTTSTANEVKTTDATDVASTEEATGTEEVPTATDSESTQGPELVAAPDVPAIMDAVQRGEAWGVIAWENNVEGYVVPNLDMLIDSQDAAGFARVGVDIAFDAFIRPSDVGRDMSGAVVNAHSHGLAQCKGFIASQGLTPEPVASNAAACRDLQPGCVALGPSICGSLYGLETFASGVQDYQGAHTEFLVVAPRAEARAMLDAARRDGVAEFETIITFIPLVTGPGVLADLLDVLRDAGLNMTSFISRPIKGNDGTYSFIATIDAAPWQPRFRAVLEEIISHGDWVKTLAVYPRRERPSPPVDAWMLPQGGVRVDPATTVGGAAASQMPPEAERELLW